MNNHFFISFFFYVFAAFLGLLLFLCAGQRDALKEKIKNQCVCFSEALEEDE